MIDHDAEQTGTSAQMLELADWLLQMQVQNETSICARDPVIKQHIAKLKYWHELVCTQLIRTAGSQDVRPGADAVALALNAARVEIVRQHDKCGADEQAVVYFDDILLKIDAALAALQPQAGASELVAWNNQHPLWEEFHAIVGDAVIDIVNHWRNDSDTGGVLHAHQKFAEAGKEIIDLFASSSSRIESIDEEHPDCRTARECELYDALMVLGSCAAAHYRDYRNWIQGGVKVEPIVSKALRLSGATPSPTAAGPCDPNDPRPIWEQGLANPSK